MHGRREGDESKRLSGQHMWPPVGIDKDKSTTEKDLRSPAVGSSSPSYSPTSDFFSKDGRKIRVGDCALFQAGDAPPFIGLIRWIKTREEDEFARLCVSWLYRPSDVKLLKGVQLISAPNELFYSFHKDVISSASILHPCRVAFLKKGADPPSDVPSFVCRRVYDIEHKCLWWLTDKDYINERQEEVDALLDKTRQEMHAAVQSGGRSSPKPLNGPSSSSQQQNQQIKSVSDSSQNLGTGTASFPSSQSKGKKRERSDQVAEPANKRELRDRSNPKSEDADPTSFKLENMKVEIAKLTEKGGLTDPDAVNKLVSLLDRTARKLDFAARVVIADVIATTNQDECLDRFVQLRGVPILDEWLQEAHKQGKKNSDSGSPKEGDSSNNNNNNNNNINKPVEDLLLALLRALDKLPVNLNALRTCNIGKSVNHLKNHKNLEIQKKARFLVDTWKKRVDAEMKINDAKIASSGQAVTWQGKPSFLEVNRRPGSSEPVIRGPTTHLGGSKSLPVKTVLNKPQSPLSGAAVQKGNSSSEPPAGGTGEEKSTSSSQSLNNSQSCSSDHAKTLGGGSPWKEDARSSTAGSIYKNRQRRLPNGPGSGGPLKEPNNNMSPVKSGSLDKDKVLQTGLTSEKPVERERETAVTAQDHANSTRLIVRLPNLGRSPARGSGTSTGTVQSDEASPVTDKQEASTNDRKSNEVKEGTEVGASEEGDRLSAVIEEDEKGKATAKASCSSIEKAAPKNSFSSMNALIESCVVSTPPQAGDDLGMNLLASVATGEISKSELDEPCETKGDEEPGISPPLQSNQNVEENKVKTETNKDSDGLAKQECDNSDENNKCVLSEKASEGNLPAKEIKKKEGLIEEVNNNNSVIETDKVSDIKITKSEPSKDIEMKDSNESDLNEPNNNHVDSTPKADPEITGGKDEAGSSKTGFDFDLNEGTGLEETDPCESANSEPTFPPLFDPHSPFFLTSSTNTIHAPISVLAAPAKVPFEPPETLLSRPNKGETGWKGSAATSAFRPAEPRKVLEMHLGCGSDTVRASSDKSSKRPLLEFDLNVADDLVVEDEVEVSQNSAQTTGSSARGFDLNCADVDTAENNNNNNINNNGLFLSNSNLGSIRNRIEVPLMPIRPPFHHSGSHNNNNNNATVVANGFRDFDLNNGPALDEIPSSEPIARGQIVRNSSANTNIPFLHPVAGLRMNNNASELNNNMASWFSAGNSYPAVAIPSFIPERPGEPPQPYSIVAAPPQRMMGQVAQSGGPHPFPHPVLSSSPAGMAPFPPNAAFPYPGFHFGPTFPLGPGSNYAESPSGMYPVGPTGQVAMTSSPHYPPPRPYLMNLQESSNSSGGGGSHDGRRWAPRQTGGGGLDLNSGPGNGDVEGKDEKGGGQVMTRQILPQGFAEEQASRMFQMGGGGSKRKEPDGGWDSDASRSVHKQLSWH